MKKALFLFLLVYSYCLYSQADYYWYKGEKIYLEKIDTKKFIVFDALDDSVSLNSNIRICNPQLVALSNNL